MAKTLLLTVAAGLALAGCPMQAAQMRTPAGLSESGERLPVAGAGHGTRGDFTFAGLAGRFERSKERLSFFDTLQLGSGYTRFTLGAGSTDAIDADCRMRDRTIDLGMIEVTPRRMAYRCSVATPEGDGWIEVQEVHRGLAGAMMKRERRGAAVIDGVPLEILSIHKMKGSPIELAAPIGYVFQREGRPIGAVDINGRPTVMLAPGADAAERRATYAAALALALFWDPATTDFVDG